MITIFALKGSIPDYNLHAGHVAGVVNPANNKKYSYIIGENVDADSKIWQQSAKSEQGSWWNGWKEWLTVHSGNIEKSIDYDKLEFIEPAPGNYVKK